MPSKLKLRFLPQDGHYWRIDWFGDVGYRSQAIRTSTPSIRVSLSQWKDGNLDAERIKNVSGPHQRQAHIPVGFLGKVKLGDVWRNGVLVTSPPYQIEAFADVLINRGTTNIIKAGLSTKLAGSEIFYLPLNVHPYHSAHTGSYCVLVELPDGKRLIVPAIELVRFYFGSSSNLIDALFRVPLTQNKLWLDSQNGYGRNKSKIILAAGLSGWSAADIARMAFNSNAWHAAQLVNKSLSVANSLKQSAYPRTHFPFVGKTTLEASGIWLPFGTEPSGTFLVFRLLSCSHPFPFNGLIYEIPGRTSYADRSDNKVSSPSQTNEKLQNPPIVAKRSSKNIVEEDPSKGLGIVKTVIENETHFPDLKTKSVRMVLETGRPEAQIQLTAGKSIAAASTGSDGMADDVRPIDLIRQSELANSEIEPQLLLDELFSEWSASGLFDKIELVCIEPGDDYGLFSVYMSFWEAFSRNADNPQEKLLINQMTPSSSIQIAEVMKGGFKAFLLITKTNKPSKQTHICVAAMPAARKYESVGEYVAEALDAQGYSGIGTEIVKPMQHFLSIPDINLENDWSGTISQISHKVELYCSALWIACQMSGHR